MCQTTRYCKKPVEIDAIKISEIFSAIAAAKWSLLPDWVRLGFGSGRYSVMDDDRIEIRTLEGGMIGEPDDYLIKGIAGEFYPCKPDIFELTYEKV